MRAMKAVLYTRKSKGEDVGAHFAALERWAAGRGWEVIGMYHDTITGDPVRRKGDPPGLRAAISALAQHRAEVLGVYAADRIVRSPLHLIQFVARLQSYGAHVASYQDGGDLDTTTEMGELMLFLRGWYSRWEMKTIRARTLVGIQRARAEGRRPGPKRAGRYAKHYARAAEMRSAGRTWGEILTALHLDREAKPTIAKGVRRVQAARAIGGAA